MQLSPKALTWLTAILKERFGLTFTLAYRDHALVMQLAEQQGEIIFTQPNAAFTQASTNAPCTSWNVNAPSIPLLPSAAKSTMLFIPLFLLELKHGFTIAVLD